MFSIDATSYDKAAHFPLDHGYEARDGAPTSGIQHTTNNRQQNTAFDGEATFLFESPDVSSHFLIGKDGRIVQFLDPRKHAAWHAGLCLSEWRNQVSIGVEWHVSQGERPTQAQKDAGAWLWGALMARYGFGSGRIETHRFVARPPGRKSDPEGFTDAEFYAWRNTLVSAAPDPWAGWGARFPLDPAQHKWAIPQCWLRNTWLGEARSFELYEPDGLRSLQYFQAGYIVWEKQPNKAQALKAIVGVA